MLTFCGSGLFSTSFLNMASGEFLGTAGPSLGRDMALNKRRQEKNPTSSEGNSPGADTWPLSFLMHPEFDVTVERVEVLNSCYWFFSRPSGSRVFLKVQGLAQGHSDNVACTQLIRGKISVDAARS